jgi:polyisoprenyl-phosphate glycosyltransferase
MPSRSRSTSDDRPIRPRAEFAGQVTPTLDIVVPVFNEADVLREFHCRLEAVCDELEVQTRFIYVDDGSRDATAEVLWQLSDRDPRVVSVELTRNFGHQAALTAGLSIAGADFVITMDGDGQHPPDLIPTLLDHVRGDFDVVLTVRRSTAGSGVAKRVTSTWFYRILNWISATKLASGTADYRALRQEVADSLRHMPEYHRFIRGMVSWLGYRTLTVEYDAPPRIAGSSKYSIGKMLKLALDATFSFSLVPLQISATLGLFFFILAAAEAAYVLSFWARGEQQVLAPGWSSLMFMLLIVGGMLMIMLGIVGAYVGYTLQEVKGRPIFLIKSVRSSVDRSRNERVAARLEDGPVETEKPSGRA